MKPLVLLVAISGMLAPAWAQQPPEHPNGVQRIQLDCRDPATSGRALQSDELLVNGMACRIVKPEAVAAPVSKTPNPVQSSPSMRRCRVSRECRW